MKTFALYHWWDDPKDAPPYTNLRVPILLSITTLRAVSDMPIIVLDLSNRNENEWLHFPDKLNFQIHKIKPHLPENCVKGWKYLSRLFDIRNNQNISDRENVMYVDSDVFWLRNPEPFLCPTDKMCLNRWNTGYFYYSKYGANKFWEIFEAYTKSAIHSPEHRKLLMKHVGYDSWLEVWDEMTITYMAHHNPDTFNFLPHDEHAFMSNLQYANMDQMKMLHANGLSVCNPVSKNQGERSHCRGLTCLIIKEFYENIIKVLDQKDIDLIFTQREQRIFLPKQISLTKDVKKLLDTKGASSHWDLMKCIQMPCDLMI